MIKIETKITSMDDDAEILAVSVADRMDGKIMFKFWTESGPSSFLMTKEMSHELASQILREKWIL